MRCQGSGRKVWIKNVGARIYREAASIRGSMDTNT